MTWRPARIAPPPEVEICATDDEQRRNCQKNAGKIVRVRELGRRCEICGGKSLTIHPEDFRKLDLPRPPKGYLALGTMICETQVQMD